MICTGCAEEFGVDALSCPTCQRLVHAPELERLAASAAAATTAKQWGTATEAWRAALALLPAETKQYQIVLDKIAEAEANNHAAETEKKGIAKWVGALGPAGLLLWKFKTILLIVLSKGKLLLLGLTKLSTLSTMGLSLVFYWQIYGWWFAVGFLLSIYVHEIGHVWELRRFGIPASAPMFIPGIGAMVFLKGHPTTVGQDARVGLAGPIWGTTAALFCWVVYGLTGNDLWKALARWGAWINLFNLVPVWQLDGGRAFNALTRRQRAMALGTILLMWVLTEDTVLFLLACGAGYRMFSNDYAEKPDNPILLRYAALLVVLGFLCMLQVSSVRR